jgi:hypothetical protein
MADEFPIITITLQGMRQTIQHAFTDYLAKQDRDVQAALKAAIDNFDIKAAVAREIDRQFPQIIQSMIGDALRGAIWNNATIRAELTKQLAEQLAEAFVRGIK